MARFQCASPLAGSRAMAPLAGGDGFREAAKAGGDEAEADLGLQERRIQLEGGLDVDFGLLELVEIGQGVCRG